MTSLMPPPLSKKQQAFYAAHKTRMEHRLHAMQAAQAADGTPSLVQRRDRLTRLLAALDKWEGRLMDALMGDFGYRIPAESEIAELVITKRGIRHSRKALKGWMKPEKRKLPLALQPASARVTRQPLGVVGVIAPWNYPVQLALLPMVDALAGGNRVMLKPSELTPATADTLADMLRETFDVEEVLCITGDARIAANFAALPFDHLLFTGSTAVGRKVAAAAAQNLTPITLELGGKSPVVIEPGYDVKDAATFIGWGKGFNAGQTCIAPDYVLAPKAMQEELADALLLGWAARLGAGGEGMTRIINDRHFDRLVALREDARDKGAEIIKLAGRNAGERLLPPTIILGATPDMAVMQEEIFGPILPVVTAESLEQAASFINRHAPDPLTLYIFARGQNYPRQLAGLVRSGSVAINGTLLHFGCETLPIGGVGASGMGEYHGHDGFLRMTRPRPEFRLGRPHLLPLLGPPYGKLFGLMKRLL